MGNIWLCKHCIDAIRSRGEKVFVSDETTDEIICEWCEDPQEDEDGECVGYTVYDCMIRM